MKLRSALVTSIVLLAPAFAVGCAADSSREDDGEDLGDSSHALGSTVDVPNPSGVYFAAVTANGTGCPAGTWDAAISGDGKAFTVTFSAYEAIVNPGESFQIKDCTLGIDMKTPSGYSFAVSKFHYQGYALLDKAGMTAKQTAKYYFQGNPVPARELRSDLTGPFDDSYIFSDTIGTTDLVWSPCGATRRLNVQTRLTVRNNQRKTGTGYTNTTSVDGTTHTPYAWTFWLNWHSC